MSPTLTAALLQILDLRGVCISTEARPSPQKAGGQGDGQFATVEERYADDAKLLKLHKKKLAKPGWAGSRDATEKEYIRRVRCRQSATLSQRN